MGERNSKDDSVKPFANIIDSEFLEVVHRLPQNTDAPGCPVSFPLKSFLNLTVP